MWLGEAIAGWERLGEHGLFFIDPRTDISSGGFSLFGNNLMTVRLYLWANLFLMLPLSMLFVLIY